MPFPLKLILCFVAYLAINVSVLIGKPSAYAFRVLPKNLAVDDLTRQMSISVPGIGEAIPSQPGAKQVLIDYLQIAIPAKSKNAIAASHRYGNEELAWGLGYDLQAAVEGYIQTRDPRFLDLFEDGFEVALSLRDDVQGRRDALRGRVMPAWGTFAYSDDANTWIAWDALTGMVIYPAVKYAALVLSDESQSARHDRARRYLAKALESLDSFKPWWRDGGYYYDPLYKAIAPLNHMNLLGSVHVVLCASFAIQDSCEKAAGSARFLQAHLRNPDGECIWSYWEGVDLPHAPGEDITHAFLNVGFADLAEREAIVFTDDDMECIASMFLNRVVRKNGDWAALVDGSGNLISDNVQYGLMDFVRLGRFRPEIVPLINSFVFANENTFPLGLLSYATGPSGFAMLLQGGKQVHLPKVSGEISVVAQQ